MRHFFTVPAIALVALFALFALFALAAVREAQAQAVASSELVGTWLGMELINGKLPPDTSGMKFTLVLKDSTWTESTNGKNDRLRPKPWHLVADTIDLVGGGKYLIRTYTRDSAQKTITEFQLSPPLSSLHTGDTSGIVAAAWHDRLCACCGGADGYRASLARPDRHCPRT